MLNFIIGRNNSGKTEKIRALIAERASENKKCILIVPEQFSFESERSILEKIGAQKMLRYIELYAPCLRYKRAVRQGTQ